MKAEECHGTPGTLVLHVQMHKLLKHVALLNQGNAVFLECILECADNLDLHSVICISIKLGGKKNVQVLLAYDKLGMGMLNVLQTVVGSCRIKRIETLKIAPGLPAWMTTKNSLREATLARDIGGLCCEPALTLHGLYDLVGILEPLWISVSSLINIMLEVPFTTISLT